MDALAPLIGVLIMSTVLVANFFRTAWVLGVLRAFGRRGVLAWRTLAAAAMAACLPMIGAVATLGLVPADNGVRVASHAVALAVQLGAVGLILHTVNDVIMAWCQAPGQA